MGKAKRKTLPKDFETLLAAGNVETLKAVFDACDVNATGGVFHGTAISFNACPDELTRWLVERGANLEAADKYGTTPLQARSGHWQGRIEVLLELGADIHSGENGRGTPLHKAAGVGNARVARLLLDHGARADALDSEGRTPLANALAQCSNAKICETTAIVELLLPETPGLTAKRTLTDRLLGRDARVTSPVTSEMKAQVLRIGKTFEFHRAGFNPDSVEEYGAALDRLYVLLDVPPVPRRAMHDGKSPIVAKAARWQDRHQELWQMLVPSSGAADTVQGEVIRISGRISDEIAGNGGVNWDADYRRMADAFLAHVASGSALSTTMLADASIIISEVKRREGDTDRLCEFAVEWVSLNPAPKALGKPNYSR